MAAGNNKKHQSVEVRITIDGRDVTAVPGRRSAGIDRLLEHRGAQSFVFIPLSKLNKKGERLRDQPLAVSQRKARLPAGDWYDGALHSVENSQAVPGVLAFDVRRRTARQIAAAVGVPGFIWGTAGAPVERHDASLSENDGGSTWAAARRQALVGLTDMAVALRHLDALPTAVEESQTTMGKFWQIVALVLGASVAAGALKETLQAALGMATGLSWLSPFVSVVLYPFVIPAVLVGVYLRALMKKAEHQARDFTAAEAEQNWVKVAPHLLALWALCWVAIVLLTWLQSVPSTSLGVLGRTDGVTNSLVICVWMLLPIASTYDFETLFKSALEAAINAAVSIFTIRLSLYITNLLTDMVLEVLTGLLPFDIPESLKAAITAVIDVGAEVFFVAVLLGYAWSRTRQQFKRL